MRNHANALKRSYQSLQGLAVGDAFGQMFFSSQAIFWLDDHKPPPPPWYWTNDTAMAISIYKELAAGGEVDQDRLARRFSDRYTSEPNRGYGIGAAKLLAQIAAGDDWRVVSRKMFAGDGSMGNGGAMRVAPLGAYFASQLDVATIQAHLTSEITHANSEGIAGTVAVAVGASLIAHGVRDADALFDGVLESLPDTVVRSMIEKARDLPPDTDLPKVINQLGNGDALLAWDTVPFTLWVAFHSLDDFEHAVWTCVTARGDRDTTSAIVGGLIAAGGVQPPDQWIAATEALPKMD